MLALGAVRSRFPRPSQSCVVGGPSDPASQAASRAYFFIESGGLRLYLGGRGAARRGGRTQIDLNAKSESTLTAVCLIAELGDPTSFRSAGAIASYVGVAPRLRQSGERRFSGSPSIPFGNACLRKALWIVVLNAVRCNPSLRQYHERLRGASKPGKVAVIAAMQIIGRRVERFSSSPTIPTCVRPPIDSRGQCGHRWGHFRGIRFSNVALSAKEVGLRAQDSPNDRWCPELRQWHRHVENTLHAFLNYGIAGGTQRAVPI